MTYNDLHSNPVRGRAVQTFDLLGVPVAATGFEELVELLVAAPRRGERLRVHFASIHTLLAAKEQKDLASVLGAGEAVVAADGMPLVWCGRARRAPVERCCGPDVMPELVRRSSAEGRRHYFYGGPPGVAEDLAATFARTVPGFTLAGVCSPPYRPLTAAEQAAMIADINAARPDYVWVGLGSPKQDYWIAEHRNQLDASVLLAVGAAFAFESGHSRRAPAWMQRTGLEWIHRFKSEPRRLWRRYVLGGARFVLLAAMEVSRDRVSLRRGRA